MKLPPSLPLPTSLQSLLWVRRPTQLMDYWARRYGHAYRLKLMPYELHVFSDPDSIRSIFAAKSEDMHAGEINRILRVLVGQRSVLLLDDAEHMRHRKLLLPSFHGERMRFYGNTMAEITRASVVGFREGSMFALHPHTQEITLQIILRTVFGADEGAELDTLRKRIKLLLSRGESRLAFPLLLLLANHPELEARQPLRYMLRARAATDELLYQIIAARRADPNAATRKDVLATLMQARDEDGEPMTDRELRDELVTALAAGHETTATALAWAVERILAHPDVHARLKQELRTTSGAPLTPEQIAALPYLDATIKEVLRLRPIIPIVGRILKKPTNLGGYDLPAQTAVAACIYLAHRNPDIYPQPDEFRPERFLNAAIDPVTWLPFGGGIRRCVGAQFATYEMKIVLATLLASCDFELAQPSPVRIVRRAITLFPERGTCVRLIRKLGVEGQPALAHSA